MSVAGLVGFGLWMVIWFYVAYRVAADSKSRGGHWIFHGGLAAIFGLPYAGLYFILAR